MPATPPTGVDLTADLVHHVLPGPAEPPVRLEVRGRQIPPHSPGGRAGARLVRGRA